MLCFVDQHLLTPPPTCPPRRLGRDGTSAAVTRVSIDFAEVLEEGDEASPANNREEGRAERAEPATWRTVGAHSSIIEASFRALVDGLEWAIRRCDADGCALPAELSAARKAAAAAQAAHHPVL